MSWNTSRAGDALRPCGSVGHPAHARYRLILQLNELKALTHPGEPGDQQQNSHRGEDTQNIIQVNGVVQTAEVKETPD